MEKKKRSYKSMKVSLKTIAEYLNVSVATVSWVLSGLGDEKKISLSTQERVLACAKEMDYRPNMLARALNSGRSNTVGLIIPSIADSFYSGVAKAIERTLDNLKYSLMICSSESDGKREERMINMLKSYQVDGIIIAPTKKTKDEIQKLIDEDYPVVFFDRFFSDLTTNYVIINNEESSFSLVEHLILKGARKIAILTTNPHLLTLNFRMDGYINALKKYDIEVNDNLIKIIDIHNYEEKLPGALDEIFEKEPDVDGFFFTTHILAMEAFKYFMNHNIDYNKFELASIHEESLFPLIAPQINVALMPIPDIGKKVVEILLKQINLKESNSTIDTCQPVDQVTIPCKLIYRD
ncbi:MAG: LacI family transcriptional regulator [Bacteroides sp.]|jgi:LacI family transcriptional regulator|nr:LacI family transcriptional regulator [Bacteroides sp.]MCI1681158.1 LacI family transcriptional regulator [Bacteroides sp.]